MENRLTLNTIPAPTFRWLRMYGAELERIPAIQPLAPAIELPAGVRVEKGAFFPAPEIRSGAGKELEELLFRAEVPSLVCRVREGVRASGDDALRFYFELPDTGEERNADGRRKDALPEAAAKFASVSLTMEEDSALTAVMDLSGSADAKGLAGLQTKIRLGRNAKLKLVQLIRPGSGYTVINDVGAELSDGASLEVIHLILGGKRVYQGLSAGLSGRGSSLSADIGYVGGDESDYDMNYEAVHTGEKTSCEIHAKGVLRDHARKIFRDTIDFRKGCAGAVGNETEDVLLMDETVRNKSIPVILCAEEDVVGNHGATIGRLDEDLLFYMESRGMKQDEIYEMMAKARLDALFRKVPDVKTRCALLEAE